MITAADLQQYRSCSLNCNQGRTCNCDAVALAEMPSPKPRPPAAVFGPYAVPLMKRWKRRMQMWLDWIVDPKVRT